MAAVSCVLSRFEINKTPGDTTDLKLYIKATKEIDKETYKIDIWI